MRPYPIFQVKFPGQCTECKKKFVVGADFASALPTNKYRKEFYCLGCSDAAYEKITKKLV